MIRSILVGITTLILTASTAMAERYEYAEPGMSGELNTGTVGSTVYIGITTAYGEHSCEVKAQGTLKGNTVIATDEDGSFKFKVVLTKKGATVTAPDNKWMNACGLNATFLGKYKPSKIMREREARIEEERRREAEAKQRDAEYDAEYAARKLRNEEAARLEEQRERESYRPPEPATPTSSDQQ